jgi:type VI secretion system secreted protein VgrG
MPSALNATLTSSFGDALRLRRMQGVEALGQPFVHQLELLSLEPDLDPRAVLGQPMLVRLEQRAGPVRHFHGLVSHFAHHGSEGPHAIYRATLRPWVWLLPQLPLRRVHARGSVPELALRLLGEHPASALGSPLLSRAHPPRERFVQYKEPTLAFVARLLAEEGAYYRFAHGPHGHTLVLGDGPAADGGEVRYLSGADPALDHLPPTAAGWVERWSASDTESGAFEAEGELFTLAPGSLFQLAGHPHARFNARYCAVSARYQLEAFEADRFGFRCQLRAVLEGAPLPLPHAPRPVVCGAQPASVLGASEGEVARDGSGRVLVQLHWDGGPAQNACWVPVAHVPAGVRFAPRAGQVVLVDFLDGDPERPILTGSLDAEGAAGALAPDHSVIADQLTCAARASFASAADAIESAGLVSRVLGMQITLAASQFEFISHRLEHSELSVQEAGVSLCDARVKLERSGIHCSSAELHILKGGST